MALDGLNEVRKTRAPRMGPHGTRQGSGKDKLDQCQGTLAGDCGTLRMQGRCCKKLMLNNSLYILWSCSIQVAADETHFARRHLQSLPSDTK